MDNKFYIIDDNEQILSKAIIEHDDVSRGISVMHIDSEKKNSLYSDYKYIKFRSTENYSEIYRAEICDIQDNKIYIKNVKNISENKRMDLKIKYTYLSSIDSLKSDKFKNVPIRVRDISCSGICFFAKVDLDEDIFYETIIPFTVEPLVINIQILRKQKCSEKEIFEYGCKFIGLEDEEEKMIRNGIFRIQRISRHK